MFDFTRADLMFMEPNDALMFITSGEYYAVVQLPVPYSKLTEDGKELAHRTLDIMEEKSEYGLVVKWGRLVETKAPIGSDVVWRHIQGHIFEPCHYSVIKDDPAHTYYEFI